MSDDLTWAQRDWCWTQQYAFLHAAWTRACEEGRWAHARAIRQEMAPCT